MAIRSADRSKDEPSKTSALVSQPSRGPLSRAEASFAARRMTKPKRNINVYFGLLRTNNRASSITITATVGYPLLNHTDTRYYRTLFFCAATRSRLAAFNY
jgi:hypothetical protein